MPNAVARPSRAGQANESTRARQRLDRQIYPERFREYGRRSSLKRQYGITLEDYDALFEAQQGLCAICNRQDSTRRRLAVDHDHETGRIRGLLCYSCNTKLAFAEKYETRITEYLGRA